MTDLKDEAKTAANTKARRKSGEKKQKAPEPIANITTLTQSNREGPDLDEFSLKYKLERIKED